MKKIHKKEAAGEVVDKWDGVLDPIPFRERSKNRSDMRWYNVYNLIDGYEAEARAVLKEKGYPTTIKGLLKKPLKEREIRDIARMLLYFREVRLYLSFDETILSHKEAAEKACMAMAHAVQSAMKAKIRPMEPHMNRGIKTVQAASLGGKRAKQTADERHKIWQADADSIWGDRSSYSRWRVAGMLAAKYAEDPKLGAKQNTIYKKIRK